MAKLNQSDIGMVKNPSSDKGISVIAINFPCMQCTQPRKALVLPGFQVALKLIHMDLERLLGVYLL